MPNLNEHSFRLRSLSDFNKDTMRSKKIADGIRIIFGTLKDGKSATQTYRFKREKYTPDQAKKWLKENNINYIRFEEAKTIQNFERSITLQCSNLELHPQEIKRHIPLNVLQDIKNKDSQPYFRAYSIVQEGIAKPRVIGEQKSLPTKWTRQVIQSVKNVVKKGIQFFIGHNEDNSTDNRKSIGEVVGNFQKKIGDTLHNIVIGYFPNKNDASQYDVCSIEGNVIAQDYDDVSIIRKLSNLTGIALGNSAYDKPAFPGAKYMGAIQAFDDKDTNTSKKNKREEITMTFDEIKKAVKDMNIFPAQLYTEDDLKNDRVFSRVFNENEKLKGLEVDYKSQLETKEGEIKKLQKDMTLATANDKLIKSLPDGVTDAQKTFITKRFKPETMEDLEDDKVKDFIDNSIKEFSEYASIFGAKEDDKQSLINDTDNKSEDDDEIDQIVNDIITEPQGV